MKILTMALVFASILVLILSSPLFTTSIEASHAETLIVSTRDHFLLYSGDLYRAGGYTDVGYDGPSSLPSCTSNREIVIYVHGWMTHEEYDEIHSMVRYPSAITQFNIVKQSLESVGYSQQPIIGFTWYSDTWYWNVAKKIADQNGLKLAKFILDYKGGCENAEICLVGHSLGARVILNALHELHSNGNLVSENGISWNAPNKNYKITSIHLLGVAVNPEELSITQGFGVSIREEVNKFYNKYSTEDTALEDYYRGYEGGHIALGEEGAQGMAAGLRNIYHEQEVSTHILLDVNGDGTFIVPPDRANHMGYADIVDSNGVWIDEGVMDVVVLQDWRNQ